MFVDGEVGMVFVVDVVDNIYNIDVVVDPVIVIDVIEVVYDGC